MDNFQPDRLKELRKNHPRKLTQQDVARALGITRATYGKKEAGKVAITLEDLRKLAAFFRVDVQYFFSAPNDPAAQVPEPPPPCRPQPEEDPHRMIMRLSSMLLDLHAQIQEKNEEIEELKKSIKSNTYNNYPPPNRSKALVENKPDPFDNFAYSAITRSAA